MIARLVLEPGTFSGESAAASLKALQARLDEYHARNIAVIVAFLVVVTYNAIVALRNRIAKAWANIDVALRQRHDQLPNLLLAVRGLMAYERDVLVEVTRARTAYVPSAPTGHGGELEYGTSRKIAPT